MVNLTAFVEYTEQVFPVELPESFSFADFKAYLSAECGIEPQDQIITLNGKEVTGESDSTLSSIGFKDGDFFNIKHKGVAPTAATPLPQAGNPFATGHQVPIDNPQQFETVRQQLLNNQQMRQQVESKDPELAAHLSDPVKFREALSTRMSHLMMGQGRSAEDAEWARLSQDPDNPENQKRILEIIEQRNIEENLQNALDLTPESFTKVDMLYINVEIDGFPIKAFVDSGAQGTIISPKLAEKCNLHRLIDRRFSGIAKGVGSGEIIGRIHSAPLKIGGIFVPCSFTVLDTNVDMLLGLDMLKRHQANIDLKNNVLKIADTETPFLTGKDVPNDFDPEKLAQTLGDQVDLSSEPKRQKFTPSTAAAQAALSRNSGSQSTTAPATSTASRPQPIQPNEQAIAQLVGLGFSRAEAISALAQAGGNVDMAAALLFQ